MQSMRVLHRRPFGSSSLHIARVYKICSAARTASNPPTPPPWMRHSPSPSHHPFLSDYNRALRALGGPINDHLLLMTCLPHSNCWQSVTYMRKYRRKGRAISGRAGHLSMRSWSFICTSPRFMCLGTPAWLAMANKASASSSSGPL